MGKTTTSVLGKGQERVWEGLVQETKDVILRAWSQGLYKPVRSRSSWQLYVECPTKVVVSGEVNRVLRCVCVTSFI